MAPERTSRREFMFNAPPLAEWPTCAENGIRDIEAFRRRCIAITMYFDMYPIDKIVEVTGIARCRLSVWAKQCLELAEDGRIRGFRALIPFARSQIYRRRNVPGKKFPDARGGMSGALQLLLTRYPDLEKQIIVLIEKDKKNWPVPHEFRIRARDVHRHFIKVLTDLGAPLDQWPFTTKYLGYRSITKFTHDLIFRNFSKSVSRREKKNAKAKSNVGVGFAPILAFDNPFGCVEIDAYRVDALLTVALQTPEGTEVEQLLDRLWLLAVVDRASTAVLAWLVVYRSEVSAADVLRVIRLAATEGLAACTRALSLPGLTVPALNSQLQRTVNTFAGALWSTTMLDNALANLSKAVHAGARRTLGFALNYGPKRHFERRPHIERTFRKIHDDIFQRLPSTTGSHPHAYRAPDAEGQAVRQRIRACDVEEVVSAYFAQHNFIASNEEISNLTPVEFLNYFLEKDDHIFPRKLPREQLNTLNSLGQRTKCSVRGDMKNGQRPYIQLDRVHYTSPVLSASGDLIGKELIVEILDDYRHVRAFLPNGAELGFLTAQGRWGRSPHSRATRKAINSLLNNGTINLSAYEDPIPVYMRYLGTIVEKNRNKRDKSAEKGALLSKRQATELARVAKETGAAPTLHYSSSEPTLPPVKISAPLMDKPLPDFSVVKNSR